MNVAATARPSPSAPDAPGAAAPSRPAAHGASGQGPVRDAGPASVDLRLVPAALAAWAAALVVTRIAPAACWAAGLGASLLASLLLVARVARPGPRSGPGGRAARGHGRGVTDGRVVSARGAVGRHARTGERVVSALDAGRRRARRSFGACVLALVATGGVLLSGAAQRSAADRGLLPEAARDAATVLLTGVVVGDPHPQPPPWPGAPERVSVVLAASHVTSHGRADGATGEVLVVGPAAWASVPYRSRVEVTGRVEAGRAGERVVAVLATDGAPHVVARPPWWAALTSSVRARVGALARDQPGDAGALLAGITIGDTSRLPDDLVGALRTAGLTHVTAVSGAHFALVVALVLALASTVRAPRRARAGCALLATAATVALVHPDPSVVRAAGMGLVGVLALLTGRPARAPAALSAAVVVLLTVDPWLGLELGFVLSVLATAGLVAAGTPLARRWSHQLGRGLADALALPLAAQLACAPVLLLVQPGVSTYAVPANVLAAPAVGPATVLGLAAGLVDPLCHPLAELLAGCAAAAAWWVAAVARTAAAAPGARLAWAGGPLGVAALAVGSCVLLLLLLRRRRE